jgi:hypothetical protein
LSSDRGKSTAVTGIAGETAISGLPLLSGLILAALLGLFHGWYESNGRSSRKEPESS